MNMHDKIRMRKRALIETVNDELKNVCHIEHTRHRSIDGFTSNLIAGLIAYNLFLRNHYSILTSLIKVGLLHKIIIPSSRITKLESV